MTRSRLRLLGFLLLAVGLVAFALSWGGQRTAFLTLVAVGGTAAGVLVLLWNAAGGGNGT